MPNSFRRLFSNKVADSDSSYSVEVDSYDSAKDLQPDYDPLSLKRKKTVTDKDLSPKSNSVDQDSPQTGSFTKPTVSTPTQKPQSFEKAIESTIDKASESIASILDMDSLEERFEDMFGYKVSISKSKKKDSLHENARKNKAAMKMVEEE